MLNALLKIEIKQIVIREEVSLQQLSVQEKGGRLDLQAILNDGVIVNEKINQWLAFIDDYDKEGIELAEKNNKTLERARFEINCLTGDAAVQRLAELREKWDMDWNSGMYWVKEEGKEENKKEIARKLIKMKLPIEQIMEATGFTKEQIERLEKEDKEE